MSAPPDTFVADGALSFEESLRADTQTLANRGFASNFCAAWLTFWRFVLTEYGEQLEETHRLTFPESRPMTGARIVASVARSTMALMSAAVRALMDLGLIYEIVSVQLLRAV